MLWQKGKVLLSRAKSIANLLDEEKPIIKIIVNESMVRSQVKKDDKPLKEMFDMMRDGLFYELGVILPEVQIATDNKLKEIEFQIQLNDLLYPPVTGLEPDEFLVNDTVDRLSLLNIKGREAINPANGSECAIVRDEGKTSDACQQAGLTTWGPSGFLVLRLSAEIRKRAQMFLTRKVAQYNLELLRTAFPDLVTPARERLGLPMLTLILKDLLEEEITIRDLRSILESLLSIRAVSDVDQSKFIVFAPNSGTTCFTYRTKKLDTLDVIDYSNCVRTSLKRYISHKYTRGGNTLVVYLTDPKIEQRIREIAVRPLSNEEIRSLTKVISDEVSALPPTAQNPVILTTMEIRKTLRKLIEKDFSCLAVVCYQELSPDMNIQPIARISWK
jgi:type III secretion protein V